MDERFGRRYEDDERRFTESAPREYEGRRYRGEGYYGGYYQQPARSGGAYERRDRPEDRGLLDRAGDELRSWFGDEEAERRRRADEREARRRGGQAQRGGEGRGWGSPDDRERERRDADYRERGEPDYVDERTWARQWGYVEHPHERGATFGPPREERRGAGYGRGPIMREDWTTRGPFAGRGPKGYERSDERIREDVCDLLCEHGALDASSVEVQVQGREVTLLGFVPSRLQKRLAEDLADSVSGVHEVHNQLRVSQTATAGEPGQPGQTDRRDRAA